MSDLTEQIHSIPEVLAECVELSAGPIDTARERWLKVKPAALFTIARGTSDAAAAHAARLFILELGIPVCSFSPSLATMDGYRHSKKDVVALAISQSGASPDLIAALQSFDQDGRWALTNVDDSPLEEVASIRIPIGAGEEQSVAATKSFACSLLQLSMLVNALGGSTEVDPKQCSAAAAEGLSGPMDLSAFVGSSGAFVLGRGSTLPLAQEAALKFKEAAGLHAEAISASEVMHGPKALAGKEVPVLAFAPPGEIGKQVRSAAGQLQELGSEIILVEATPGESELESLLRQLTSFYVALLDCARSRGFDPDAPRALTKVTKTY